MPSAEVQVLVPRPAGVDPDLSPAALMGAAREYMLGADAEEVAKHLGVSKQKFFAIVRTPEWGVLQNHFRDEFVTTVGGRMTRLQNKVLDKLEDYIETGMTCYGTNKQGETFEYQREISPKELVSIGLMLNTENKRIDSLKEGDVDRKRFDSAERMRRLEAAARKMQEKEIPGTAITVVE